MLSNHLALSSEDYFNTAKDVFESVILKYLDNSTNGHYCSCCFTFLTKNAGQANGHSSFETLSSFCRRHKILTLENFTQALKKETEVLNLSFKQDGVLHAPAPSVNKWHFVGAAQKVPRKYKPTDTIIHLQSELMLARKQIERLRRVIILERLKQSKDGIQEIKPILPTETELSLETFSKCLTPKPK